MPGRRRPARLERRGLLPERCPPWDGAAGAQRLHRRSEAVVRVPPSATPQRAGLGAGARRLPRLHVRLCRAARAPLGRRQARLPVRRPRAPGRRPHGRRWPDPPGQAGTSPGAGARRRPGALVTASASRHRGPLAAGRVRQPSPTAPRPPPVARQLREWSAPLPTAPRASPRPGSLPPAAPRPPAPGHAGPRRRPSGRNVPIRPAWPRPAPAAA